MKIFEVRHDTTTVVVIAENEEEVFKYLRETNSNYYKHEYDGYVYIWGLNGDKNMVYDKLVIRELPFKKGILHKSSY